MNTSITIGGVRAEDVVKSTINARLFFGGARIFGVTFVKADGTIRMGAWRLGVKKGVQGVGLSYDADARGNLIAYDMNLGEFRTIKLDRVLSFKVRGIVVEV